MFVAFQCFLFSGGWFFFTFGDISAAGAFRQKVLPPKGPGSSCLFDTHPPDVCPSTCRLADVVSRQKHTD